MKRKVIFKTRVRSRGLRELLDFYNNSKLNEDSNFKEFSKAADLFLKNTDEVSKRSLLTRRTLIDNNSFVFPRSYTIWDKHEYTDGFEKLYFAIKKYKRKSLNDLVNLRTERQASPPPEVYEMMGHNADHKAKKMSYNYLYD